MVLAAHTPGRGAASVPGSARFRDSHGQGTPTLFFHDPIEVWLQKATSVRRDKKLVACRWAKRSVPVLQAIRRYPWHSPAEDLREARRVVEQHGYGRRKAEREGAEAALLGGKPTMALRRNSG